MAEASTKRLVIGLGTGRCGSVSLSLLLDAQRDADVLHEGMIGGAHHLIPWVGGEERVTEWIRFLDKRSGGARLFGDVGMYFLPYVEQVAREHPNARFVCLKREREETVRSFLAKTEGRNHWADHDGSVWAHDPTWDPVFPTYDTQDKAQALHRYWDAYYAEAERLEQRLPEQFRVVDMAALNSEAGRRSILRHVGAPAPFVVSGEYHANTYTFQDRLRSLWVRVREQGLRR